MNEYPRVVNEVDTLDAVLAGKSIARYGDGEFRLLLGGTSNASQVTHPVLRQELGDILITPQNFCLVAIPDMNPESPSWSYWKKYQDKYPKLLSDKVTYYSSFITRPDSASVVNTPEFYDRMEGLWRDQEIVLVRGSERSLVEDKGPMQLAKKTHPVLCAYRDAYAGIDTVERAVLALNVNRVLLCAGAMATVLAYRLAAKGFHAIDIGHVGFLWRFYESRKYRASLERNP